MTGSYCHDPLHAQSGRCAAHVFPPSEETWSERCGTGQLPGHGLSPKWVVNRYTNGAPGSAAIAGSQSSATGSATRSPAQPGAGAAAAAATLVRTCHLMPCSAASSIPSSRSSVCSDSSSSTSDPPPLASRSPPAGAAERVAVTTAQTSTSTAIAVTATDTARRATEADIVPPSDPVGFFLSRHRRSGHATRCLSRLRIERSGQEISPTERHLRNRVDVEYSPFQRHGPVTGIDLDREHSGVVEQRSPRCRARAGHRREPPRAPEAFTEACLQSRTRDERRRERGGGVAERTPIPAVADRLRTLHGGVPLAAGAP